MIDLLSIVLLLGILLGFSPELWTISVPQIGALLAGAIVAIRQIIQGAAFRPGVDTIALAILAAWGPLQIALHWSVFPYQTWNSTVEWMALAALYLTARTLARSRRALDRFLTIQLGWGSALAIASILLYFASPMKVFGLFPSRYAAYGPFVYKNHFAAFLEVVFPIAFFRMVTDRKRRTLWLVLSAALVACSVASLSRAGIVIIFFEFATLLFLTWRRRLIPAKVIRGVAIALCALVLIFGLVVGPAAAVSRFEEGNAWETRKHLYESTAEMIRTRPLTGFGLGTWRTVYPEFATFDLAVLANEAHNDWLQWTADGGILFSAVLAFLVIWVSRYGFRHIWGLGIPAVFLHCFVDYPMREPALAALVFAFAGALAATPARDSRSQTRVSEWRVVSVRTAAE